MNRNEKGFTLLEILVALTILSLGFLALVQLFSGGLRLAGQSDEYLKAVVLAQNQFQRLEALDFETETLQGEFADEESYFWEASVKPYASELRDNAFPVNEVTLRVYWEHDGREKEIQLVSVATAGTTRALTAKQLNTAFVDTDSQKESDSSETSTGNPTAPTTPNQTEPSFGSESTFQSESTFDSGGSLEAGN